MTKEREQLCGKVISLAARVLCEEGHDALTVRRIAQESGASTQLIYTLFGGKFGLVDGLYKEGFRRFSEFLESRQDFADPKRNLEQMLLAYRDFAQTNRPFFLVMFTRPVAEYTPPPESLEVAWQSFSIIVRAVESVQARGLLPGDATFIARQLWSQVHGVVTLQLIGHLWEGAGEQIYDKILRDLWSHN